MTEPPDTIETVVPAEPQCIQEPQFEGNLVLNDRDLANRPLHPEPTGDIGRILKIPRAKWKVQGIQIRKLWKDIVFKGVELSEQFPDLFTNLDYDTAIATTVVNFNDTPPAYNKYSPVNFPDEYYLLWSGFVEILRIAEAYHANNYFTGSSGGTAIAIHERFDAIRPLLLRLEGEMMDRRMRLKRRDSMIAAFGSTNHYQAWGYYGRFFQT
jgi:hypothetical protein